MIRFRSKIAYKFIYECILLNGIELAIGNMLCIESRFKLATVFFSLSTLSTFSKTFFVRDKVLRVAFVHEGKDNLFANHI